MKKRPTISDIARAADVSMMTVSRAMNNKPGVSDAVRQRIQALADEMGYRPSMIARGLATRQTATIGLVVPDIANPFFAHIARGAEDAGYQRGYNLVLMNTAEDLDREVAALDSLWQNEVDGVILCSSRLPVDELETYVERMPAAVLVNRVLSSALPGVATINVNDALGAQQAVAHLASRQRTRIAILAGPVYSISGQRRLDGYRAGLAAASLGFDPVMLEHCTPDFQGGHTGMNALLGRRPRINAVFAFNDLVAAGAIEACQEQGKRVPDDIAVIGVDDTPLATMIRPRLTTVRADLAGIGQLAMATLLAIIDQGDDRPAEALQVDPELVVRESA
jgi:LacI family transcriptional regulator